MGCVRKQTSDKLGPLRTLHCSHCRLCLYGYLLCAVNEIRKTKKKKTLAGPRQLFRFPLRPGPESHWLKSRYPPRATRLYRPPGATRSWSRWRQSDSTTTTTLFDNRLASYNDEKYTRRIAKQKKKKNQYVHAERKGNVNWIEFVIIFSN